MHAGRRDRQRVHVPAPAPVQRMTQPPPLGLQRRQREPDLVRRASGPRRCVGQATASGGRRCEHEREDEQDPGREGCSSARARQCQQGCDTARHRRHARPRRPPTPLSASEVHSLSSRFVIMRRLDRRRAHRASTTATAAAHNHSGYVPSGSSCDRGAHFSDGRGRPRGRRRSPRRSRPSLTSRS